MGEALQQPWVAIGVLAQVQPEAMPGRTRAVAAAVQAQPQDDAQDPGFE